MKIDRRTFALGGAAALVTLWTLRIWSEVAQTASSTLFHRHSRRPVPPASQIGRHTVESHTRRRRPPNDCRAKRPRPALREARDCLVVRPRRRTRPYSHELSCEGEQRCQRRLGFGRWMLSSFHKRCTPLLAVFTRLAMLGESVPLQDASERGCIQIGKVLRLKKAIVIRACLFKSAQ